MIRINLLPHRELKRKARERQFYTLTALTAGLALVIAFFIYTFLDSRIENQQGRNALLKEEIAKLEKQIEEIKRLKEQTQAMLERKRVVETLQSGRNEAVQLLDQLVRQMPDGLYLKSLKQAGPKVTVVGYAQSNARIATFMRNIETSPWIGNPEFVESKSVTLNNQKVYEFSINVMLKRATVEADKGKRPTPEAQKRPS